MEIQDKWEIKSGVFNVLGVGMCWNTAIYGQDV